jgi:hypothetical protein
LSDATSVFLARQHAHFVFFGRDLSVKIQPSSFAREKVAIGGLVVPKPDRSAVTRARAAGDVLVSEVRLTA